MTANLLFLDCISGISGDMTVGALIDLGVKPSTLEWELAKLNLEGMHLHFDREERQMVTGVKFTVHEGECGPDASKGHSYSHSHSHSHSHGEHHHHHHHHHENEHGHHDHVHGRTHSQIRTLIQESELSDWVKEKALAVFHRIAVAEGRIHGVPPDDVGFHEVGAVDSIVDIVAVCVGLESLGRPQVVTSPLFDGRGWIDCAHGRYPIPAMATLEILKDLPFHQIEENFEFITPTGAAIVAEFSEHFGPMPMMRVAATGYGIGTKRLPNRPNVLRAVLGERAESWTSGPQGYDHDEVTVLETNLDDLSPELAGALVDRLMNAGALDVWHTPIVMKKSRPGILLSVLAPAGQAALLGDLMFRETSAFGIRRTTWERWKLPRRFEQIEVDGHKIRIKIGEVDGVILQAAPEFADCVKASEALQLSIREVYARAAEAFRRS